MDLKLKHIKINDFSDIYNLTTNYNVMKWICNGKTWNKKMNIIMNKKNHFVKKYKIGYTKLNLYKIKI